MNKNKQPLLQFCYFTLCRCVISNPMIGPLKSLHLPCFCFYPQHPFTFFSTPNMLPKHLHAFEFLIAPSLNLKRTVSILFIKCLHPHRATPPTLSGQVLIFFIFSSSKDSIFFGLFARIVMLPPKQFTPFLSSFGCVF